MLEKILKILQTSNIFITGGAGVGKSFLTRQIISHYKSKYKNVVSLGSTGISAVNIDGVTLHSFFRIGICKDYEELKILDLKQSKKVKQLKEMLKQIDLIVIDEISMVSFEVMELVYFRLINSEFSGRLVVVGDFYQLAPIIKEKSLFDFKYAFETYAWQKLNFVCIELLESKRQEDKEFFKILSQIRIGHISQKEISYLTNLTKNKIFEEPITLFGTNYEADKLNIQKLENIKTTQYNFDGYSEIYNENLTKERFLKWCDNLNVMKDFQFKIGAKILFTINKAGYFYNGEQGVIVGIKNNKIIVEKLDGSLVEVELHSYDYLENILEDGLIKEKILASYFQFPLRLSYAITIHKSQGMGINNLVCNLNNIFAKGQLYVALSRGIDPKKLKIIYTRKQSFENYIKNSIQTDQNIDNFYKSINSLKF